MGSIIGGFLSFLFIAIQGLTLLVAQQSATSTTPAIQSWTTEEDHQNMKDQLGIKKLRPGPSGRENAPGQCRIARWPTRLAAA